MDIILRQKLEGTKDNNLMEISLDPTILAQRLIYFPPIPRGFSPAISITKLPACARSFVGGG
jgi:hypothetical protein